MVLHDSSNLKITYNDDTETLYCLWIGRQTEDGVKGAGDVIINIVIERGIKKILNDNRLVKGSWKDVAGWVNEIWFPQIIAAGITHFAWIYSKDIFARYSARKATGSTRIIKVFKEVEQAERWLQTG